MELQRRQQRALVDRCADQHVQYVQLGAPTPDYELPVHQPEQLELELGFPFDALRRRAVPVRGRFGAFHNPEREPPDLSVPGRSQRRENLRLILVRWSAATARP